MVKLPLIAGSALQGFPVKADVADGVINDIAYAGGLVGGRGEGDR